MKNLKSLRLESKLIEEVDLLVASNKTNFSKEVNNILKSHFQNSPKHQVLIDSAPYYPMHLTNHELIMLIEEFLTNFPGAYNCLVKVRKDAGGKGIEFQVNYFAMAKKVPIKKIRYSFSISPEWQITNLFEHSIEKTQDEIYLAKRIDRPKLLSLKNILEENVRLKNAPELNSLFKEDSWKVLFERRYSAL